MAGSRNRSGPRAEPGGGGAAGQARRPRAITLADAARAGIGVFCWCNRCGHNAVLAAEALAARLGGAYPVPEVGMRLRCSACAGGDLATRPAWPSLGQVARHD